MQSNLIRVQLLIVDVFEQRVKAPFICVLPTSCALGGNTYHLAVHPSVTVPINHEECTYHHRLLSFIILLCVFLILISNKLDVKGY